MAGAVDVGVVPLVRLVADVAGDDGDGLVLITHGTALGDVLVAAALGQPFFRLDGEDGGGQGGLAVVDVADGADVDVNLLHDPKLPGCPEQPIGGRWPQRPIAGCDLFSTTSETRTPGATE